MKGKKIILTESQLQKILLEGKSYTKKKFINKIYKVISPLTGKLCRDDAWQNAYQLMDVIDGLDFVDEMNVHCENGGYKEYDGAKSKEYLLDIQCEDILIQGVLTCHAAGTIENPWDRYDISVVLW